jgi:hypothetical protein
VFDPYYKWLGIPPKDQPPNHYRLLGIELFEADPDVIDTAANKQMAYIQGCANGPHLPLSQKLLNEIAAARLCLLDPKKKAAYDAKLKASLPATTIPLATPILADPLASPKDGSPADSPSRSDLAFQGLGASAQSPRPRRKKRPKYVLLGLATIPLLVVGLVLVFTFGRSLFTADATKGKSVGQVQQENENPGSEGKKKTPSQAKADDSEPKKDIATGPEKAKGSAFKQKTWKQIVGTYHTNHDFHRTLGELILDFGPGEVPGLGRGKKGITTQRCKQIGENWMFDWGNVDLFVITPESGESVVMRVYWKECTNSFEKAMLPNRTPDVTVVFFRSKKG